jgi:hypothetical protein
VNNQEIPTHALIECGATVIAFMNQDFACLHQIPLRELKEKKQVNVLDGRSIQSGDITHIAKVGIKLWNLGEQLPIFVTKLGHCPIVLGIAW